MKRLIFAMLGMLMGCPGAAMADHRDLALFASPVLIETGLTRFVLPRFSLKTGVKVHVEPLADRAALPTGGVILQRATGSGSLALAGQGHQYSVLAIDKTDPASQRFFDWLLSDIGQRTIGQFAPDGMQVFAGAASAAPATEVAFLSGNVTKGETLAYKNCGRCHVIGARNKMNGIGSTPSFALMRSFDDWQDRFRGFYTLNPHPSFSQITGVTAEFDPTLPPPISPLRLDLDQLDDIVAFTSTIAPADLGAPLVHQ